MWHNARGAKWEKRVSVCVYVVPQQLSDDTKFLFMFSSTSKRCSAFEAQADTLNTVIKKQKIKFAFDDNFYVPKMFSCVYAYLSFVG